VQFVGRDVTDRAETNARLQRPAITPTAANAPSRDSWRWHPMKFRTPLNGIIGMSGLLLDTPLTPEQMTYVRAIKPPATRCCR